MRLVQFLKDNGRRRVGLVEESGGLLLVDRFPSVYEMAQESIRRKVPLASVIEANLSSERLDYNAIVKERRLLPPLDHPDPARCLVSLTGLTHLGSAQSRDKMHASHEAGVDSDTDSIRMFKLGIAGGKPTAGEVGNQPEWAYKGDGRCVVAPEQALTKRQ